MSQLNVERDAADFAQNLAALVAGENSISALCRNLGINRQQFNKYLAGQHQPSRRNLSRIAQYFGVSEKDLLLPSGSFQAAYASRRSPFLASLSASKTFSAFEALASASTEFMTGLAGVYVRYHSSSIYARRILRSLLGIRVENGIGFYRYIELFPDLDQPGRTAYRFRYSGTCLLAGERLFLMDVEDRQLNEMTFSILSPVVRKPLRFLFGLTMGVAATSFREPFSTKVALEFRHKGWFRPSDLRLAGAVEARDASVPSEVKAYLGVQEDQVGEILRGR